MEKKRSCVWVRFSTILWGVLAVVLCAAPFVRAEDINSPVTGPLFVSGTVNILPGADITWGLYIMPGSTVNIYGGNVDEFGITLLLDGTDPVVTVHGTDFQVTNGTIDPSGNSFTVDSQVGGTLTGTYENGDPIELLFHSEIPINLVNTAGGGPEEIEIDIKPGSNTNAINLGSNGVIPVAILSAEGFDATTVAPENVFLAGSGVAVRGKGNKYLASQEDVNGDGLMDLVVKVETENLDPGTFQDGKAIVTIEDENGVVKFQGSDEITIVPPEK